MIGLHPTSVKENYKKELELLEQETWEWLPYIAIGEIGMDLYWDKTFINEQVEALKFQVELAKKYNLPIVIHQRDSFNEIVEVLEGIDIKGVEGGFSLFYRNIGAGKPNNRILGFRWALAAF